MRVRLQYWWFLCGFLVVVLDQVTKYWALNHLILYQPKAVFPGFNWTLAYNTGAAFSFLHSAGAWHHGFFLMLGLLMSVILVIWMLKTPPKCHQQWFGLSLILGGALGNVVDRIHLGFVVDFIDWYYQSYHWPAFNIADSAICMGAFVLILASRS